MAMNNKNDSRSKRIVFCSSCLLNTNNKVLDLARRQNCRVVLETKTVAGLKKSAAWLKTTL